jgi:hypothetical protein
MTKKKLTKRRKHLPALTPDRLKLTLADIDNLNLRKSAKGILKGMLTAASNPHSEAPGVIIQTLPPERQADIAAIQKAMAVPFSDRVKSGVAGLLLIDDAEWTRLVDEAANTS